MAAPPSSGPTRTRDLTWVVALAAALWGTDALLRLPLARELAAPTIVFAEHVVLVLVLLPFLPRAFRAFGRLDTGGKLAVVAIGAGASAVATTLFTLSFKYGDPVTPAVIQKFQPIIAILGAAVLLHERLRPSFAWFAVPALIGAWLLAFPDPLDIGFNQVAVALLAFGAAVLWAAGTVLGRLVATQAGTGGADHAAVRVRPAGRVDHRAGHRVAAVGARPAVHRVGGRHRPGARPAGDVAVLRRAAPDGRVPGHAGRTGVSADRRRRRRGVPGCAAHRQPVDRRRAGCRRGDGVVLARVPREGAVGSGRAGQTTRA